MESLISNRPIEGFVRVYNCVGCGAQLVTDTKNCFYCRGLNPHYRGELVIESKKESNENIYI